MISEHQLRDLKQYTVNIIQLNNMKVDSELVEMLVSVSSYDEYQSVVDRLWGWETDTTAYLLDGWYRKEERSRDMIHIPTLTDKADPTLTERN